MITQRAALLSFVAFCFYLIAVVNTLESYYFALTWLAIGILTASLGIALLSLIGLDCQVEIKRSRAAASLENEYNAGPLIAIAMQNSGTLNKTGVILEMSLRDSAGVISKHRFVIEAIPSGASIESDLPLLNLQRGKFQLMEVRLQGSDVLGLFRVRKKIALTEGKGREIIVGPPVLRGEKAGRGSGGGIPSFSQRALQSGQGDELRGTRPYNAGDDLRHVHWKSSARLGELVVKEFEQTGRETALVIWDGAQNTTWGVGKYNSTEWSLVLCASLCRAFLKSGTPCDFARVDGAPMVVETRSLPGNDLPTELTDALAGAAASRTKGFETALQEIPRIFGRSYSTVIIVTASLSTDVKQVAQLWRARGASVQVLLVNAASLISSSQERRSRKRASRGPVQRIGEQSIAVTAPAYAAQLSLLREAGIVVVPVAASDHTPASELRRAMHSTFDSKPALLRAYQSVS